MTDLSLLGANFVPNFNNTVFFATLKADVWQGTAQLYYSVLNTSTGVGINNGYITVTFSPNNVTVQPDTFVQVTSVNLANNSFTLRFDLNSPTPLSNTVGYTLGLQEVNGSIYNTLYGTYFVVGGPLPAPYPPLQVVSNLTYQNTPDGNYELIWSYGSTGTPADTVVVSSVRGSTSLPISQTSVKFLRTMFPLGASQISAYTQTGSVTTAPRNSGIYVLNLQGATGLTASVTPQNATLSWSLTPGQGTPVNVYANGVLVGEANNTLLIPRSMLVTGGNTGSVVPTLGVYTGPSATISFTMPPLPQEVSNLTAVVSGSTVTLSWNLSSGDTTTLPLTISPGGTSITLPSGTTSYSTSAQPGNYVATVGSQTVNFTIGTSVGSVNPIFTSSGGLVRGTVGTTGSVSEILISGTGLTSQTVSPGSSFSLVIPSPQTLTLTFTPIFNGSTGTSVNKLTAFPAGVTGIIREEDGDIVWSTGTGPVSDYFVTVGEVYSGTPTAARVPNSILNLSGGTYTVSVVSRYLGAFGVTSTSTISVPVQPTILQPISNVTYQSASNGNFDILWSYGSTSIPTTVIILTPGGSTSVPGSQTSVQVPRTFFPIGSSQFSVSGDTAPPVSGNIFVLPVQGATGLTVTLLGSQGVQLNWSLTAGQSATGNVYANGTLIGQDNNTLLIPRSMLVTGGNTASVVPFIGSYQGTSATVSFNVAPVPQQVSGLLAVVSGSTVTLSWNLSSGDTTTIPLIISPGGSQIVLPSGTTGYSTSLSSGTYVVSVGDQTTNFVIGTSIGSVNPVFLSSGGLVRGTVGTTGSVSEILISSSSIASQTVSPGSSFSLTIPSPQVLSLNFTPIFNGSTGTTVTRMTAYPAAVTDITLEDGDLVWSPGTGPVSDYLVRVVGSMGEVYSGTPSSARVPSSILNLSGGTYTVSVVSRYLGALGVPSTESIEIEITDPFPPLPPPPTPPPVPPTPVITHTAVVMVLIFILVLLAFATLV